MRARLGGARRFIRQVRRRLRFSVSPPPIILCYHRIFEPDTDPHLLSVSRDHFRQQLEVVKRLALPLSLDQLSLALDRGALPRRGVVITFDDGYFDNFENALSILREAEIPATIYIATGYVGSNREFWWDDLARLILLRGQLPGALHLTIDGRDYSWNLEADSEANPEWNVLATGEPTGRQKIFSELHAKLRPLAAAHQQKVLDQLRHLTGVPEEARPLYRCMTETELETLAREPLITLGAHTISHCDLAARTKPEQQTEISGSKKQLEKIIGRPVKDFSYPYGLCNDDSVAICAENNFRSAVTCIDQPVERNCSRHLLPRFLVRDWDGADFERRLQHFFRG
ncbi:MAG: polysaccharide deacetylase family protein [Verrucomicrobia bacterium]|nr:polysaccharide deacetylase family protein [Verrucomicrobiota bacterium]